MTRRIQITRQQLGADLNQLERDQNAFEDIISKIEADAVHAEDVFRLYQKRDITTIESKDLTVLADWLTFLNNYDHDNVLESVPARLRETLRQLEERRIRLAVLVDLLEPE